MSLDALCSKSVTSYQAKSYNYGKFQKLHFYTYHYDTWLKGEGASIDDEGFSLLKGIAIQNTTKRQSSGLDQQREMIGDYLQIDIDEEGNGAITRPLMSFHRLFFYDDGISQILASDAKLIIRAVNQFREGRLGEHFNERFIVDAIENEWVCRKYDDEFFLEGIRRIWPTDEATFKAFNLTVKKLKTLDEISINSDLCEQFVEKKETYYQALMAKIDASVNCIFQQQAITQVTLNLSGGLDSRLALAVLHNMQANYNFELNLQTSGPADHPDVVIAAQLAEALELPFINQSKKHTALDVPLKQEDYIACFSCSLGDWNSNNYRSSKEYAADIELLGADNFKRSSLTMMSSLNRWFASRIANSDLLPILSLFEVNQEALLSSRYSTNVEDAHHDFAYYLIDYFCPQIQEIPYAGQSLRQLNVKPYKTVLDSKIMPSHLTSAYFDEPLVRENLNFYNIGNVPFGLNFLTLLSNYVSKRVRLKLLQKVANKLEAYRLSFERKRRIAMDFASVAQIKGGEL